MPRDLIWLSLLAKGILEAHIRIIQDMHGSWIMGVKTQQGCTNVFESRLGYPVGHTLTLMIYRLQSISNRIGETL